MRIAVFATTPLDRPGPESAAALTVAEAIADKGVEVVLVGTARNAAQQVAGRLTIRALERSGAAALAHTDLGPRTVVIGGPTMTWAADAAIRRVIGAGEIDLVVIVGDAETAVTAVVDDAAPSAKRIGLTGAKRAATAMIKLAGDSTRAPSPHTPADPILGDFHLHTCFSPDCGTGIDDLVERALALGLGALCVTDHDSVAGGFAAKAHVEANGIPLHIAVSSEVKTQTGEVIGMYLKEDIPPGLPFADTVEAMRAQGAFIYVPHPFDSLHAIPSEPLLERMAPLIDALEVVNGRLARERFNHEALAFATRLGLPAGAGSDAHVLDGLFTAGLELPAFHDPASLALALGDARVVRNPKNILALQARKWFRKRRKPLHAE
ncbi:MAG: PHP domain-containing protein [Thermoleophilia bacterium]|nr:PHP domain-containing protein [Thermoleophilia bacterium]